MKTLNLQLLSAVSVCVVFVADGFTALGWVFRTFLFESDTRWHAAAWPSPLMGEGLWVLGALRAGRGFLASCGVL